MGGHLVCSVSLSPKSPLLCRLPNRFPGPLTRRLLCSSVRLPRHNALGHFCATGSQTDVQLCRVCLA